MKLSQMILNSMAAVADYSISFEAKMFEIERLQVAYQKALELENKEALDWYNIKFNDAMTIEVKPLPTNEVTKKVTKLQTYINAVQKHLDNDMYISEAIQNVRSNFMRTMYIKTERSYISQIKKHFNNA